MELFLIFKTMTLEVNFACFATGICGDDFSPISADQSTLGMAISGFAIQCIFMAMNGNHTVEIYMECDALPLPVLLRMLERIGLTSVEIFTFGSKPQTIGAPEALARLKFRVDVCGFVGYFKGVPTAEESLDFDIRDTISSWSRFDTDQMCLMLASDKSNPSEVVEWCIVLYRGTTASLGDRLNGLKIMSGSSRQYYVKGFECMRRSTEARIYLEVEPVVKTVLLRSLTTLFAMPVEIVTFSKDSQAAALAFVSELGGLLIEGGDLSPVPVPSDQTRTVTRFTQKDLSIWESVVQELPPIHWAVHSRDVDLAVFREQINAIHMEKSLHIDESNHYSRECARFCIALEELKMDRDRLRREINANKLLCSDGLVSFSEWEDMRSALEDRDKCITELRLLLDAKR